MTRIPIHNVGAVGIVKLVDQPDHLLPPEAWTDGSNIRFRDNKVIKSLGHKAVFDPPSIAPYWAMSVTTPTTHFWLYTGLEKAYAIEGIVHTDITRIAADYAATTINLWNGGLLGGIPILNNGIDVPQYWPLASAATPLKDLPNWPDATFAKIIRPFRQFLIALNVTDKGVVFAHRVKWSHLADPGSIPNSWDHTDPTKDAGENDLTDVQAGLIRDGLQLGQTFIIYKDNATHGMQFVGGTFVFRFFPIFSTTGILASHCVANLPLSRRAVDQHFLATGEDIIVHDGQQAESVIDKRWRRFLSNNIDTDNFDRSFCIANVQEREMWFCFPETGATWPTRAIIWNINDGRVSDRALADISFMASGVINEVVSADTWDAASGTWATETDLWGDQLFSAHPRDLLACDPVNTKLYQMDSTNQDAGVNMTAFVERTGLSVFGVDRQGNPKSDPSMRKMVTRIWPKATGGAFDVKIGMQDDIGGAITFSAAQTFTPGTDLYIDPDPPPNGRLITVRFESATDVAWELHGYDLEVTPLGSF